MLTEKAMYDRMWSWIPVLGKIIGSKRIPDRHFGPSSVSDNSFDGIRRLMQISILVQENSDEITREMEHDAELRGEIRKDLYRVAQALQDVARQFDNASAQVSTLIR